MYRGDTGPWRWEGTTPPESACCLLPRDSESPQLRHLACTFYPTFSQNYSDAKPVTEVSLHLLSTYYFTWVQEVLGVESGIFGNACGAPLK